MSRCFPFPPPGYEKKARAGDVELLTKEKHKKEKRDREKREGENKKEKKRSKDKQREKKNRKEKQKNKKDKNKNQTSDEKKIEKQIVGFNEENLGESSKEIEEVKNSKFLEELDRRVRNGGSGIRMVEKDILKKIKGNEFVNNKKRDDRRAEKIKDREGDDKHGSKYMDKDRLKKKSQKDKKKEEKKKEEKVKEKSDQNKKEKGELRGNGKDLVDTVNVKLSNVSMGSEKCATIEGDLRKRMEFETNEFGNDNEIWRDKLPSPISSFHPLPENGRKLELRETLTKCASDRLAITNNGKEHKVNGVIEAKASSFRTPSPSLPDFKYLSRILCIPKVEERYDDDDDQEWLFRMEGVQSKKPKMESSGDDENPQVWAKVLRIEPGDFFALPYVIPY